MSTESAIDAPLERRTAVAPVLSGRPAVAIRRSLVIAGAASVVLAGAALTVVLALGGLVDDDLALVPAARPACLVAMGALGVLLVTLALVTRRTRPWLRAAQATLDTAADRGLVRGARPASRGLLVAAVGVPDAPAWYDHPIAAARGTGRAWLVVTSVAVATLALGVAVGVVAPGRVPAMAGWVLIIVGSAAAVVAAALGWWLVGDIERRRLAAHRLLDPATPTDPEPADAVWPAVGMAIAGLVLAMPIATTVAGPDPDRVCPSGVLECAWLTVPVDQLDPDPRGEASTVLFGVRRATEERLGTLVIATGGPGVAGVATWESAYGRLDERLLAHYDVVAFDARGVGGSDARDCPTAALEYATTEVETGGPVTQFVTACLAEAGVDAASLGRYATDQVVEDLEAIRTALGAEQIALYGESYGTAVATRYAQAHPDRLSALLLDGVLDVAADSDGRWATAAAGFDRVLARTLTWCGLDPDCSADLADPEGTWDRLMRYLGSTSTTTTFADGDGTVRSWPVARPLVVAAMADAMYTPAGRMLALRALAAIDRWDFVPLGRLIHAGATMSRPDIVSSDFAYHAVSCADSVDADPPLDPDAYVAWARILDTGADRLRDVALSGAPCTAWPLPPSPAPSETLPTGPDVPVVLLSATGDPITTAETTRRLAERWSATADVYRIETNDGPHVTFGRGEACPDELVVDLLVEGRRPPRETRCDGDLVDPYEGVVRRSTEVDGLAWRALALDDEIVNHPDVARWDGLGQVRVGCRHGGTVTLTAERQSYRFTVDDCAVLPDEPVNGTGRFDGEGGAEYDAATSRGRWRYTVTSDGESTLDGEFDGSQVHETW